MVRTGVLSMLCDCNDRWLAVDGKRQTSAVINVDKHWTHGFYIFEQMK